MAFIELNINLNRVADALERICLVIERAFPPTVIPEQEPKKRGPDHLVTYSPSSAWEREMRAKIQRARDEGVPLDELGLEIPLDELGIEPKT